MKNSINHNDPSAASTRDSGYLPGIWCCVFLLMWAGEMAAQTGSSQNLPAAPQTASRDIVPLEIEKALQSPAGEERNKALILAAQAWAQKEPMAALAWALQLKNARPVTLAVAEECGKTNGKSAADFCVQKDQLPYLHPVLGAWTRIDPVAAAAWSMQAQRARYLSFYTVGGNWIKVDRTAATAWVVKLENVEDRHAALHGIGLVWGRSDDIPGLIAWIKQLKPEDAQMTAKGVVWGVQKYGKKLKSEADAAAFLGQCSFTALEKEAILKAPPINQYSPPKN